MKSDEWSRWREGKITGKAKFVENIEGVGAMGSGLGRSGTFPTGAIITFKANFLLNEHRHSSAVVGMSGIAIATAPALTLGLCQNAVLRFNNTMRILKCKVSIELSD